MAYEPEPGEEERPPNRAKKKKKKKETPAPAPTPTPEDEYKWPGPQPWTGKGPTPADLLFERGTKGWKQALEPRRGWAMDELWKAHVNKGLNLSDKQAVSDFLRGLDITDEVGGGRHLRNLILGNLPSEGFGMSPIRDISWGMERYMPDWKQNVDRAIQGGHLKKDPYTGLLVNVGPRGDMENPEWYNAMGERVPAPYGGAYKTQKQLDEERATAEQEAAVKPITMENVPTTVAPPPPVTAPSNIPTNPLASRTAPAITGYDVPNPRPAPSPADTFYTSQSAPPSVGTSFNFNVGSQRQPQRRSLGAGAKKPFAPISKPAAGWTGTWS